MSGPLDGIRVIDLTTVLLGPFATQILGDMGADVIKVEAPSGDPMRGLGPKRSDGMGPVFLNSNRNKRSLVLDLKADKGRDAMLKLLETADVFFHNMRPRGVRSLGLAYDDVRQVNPRLIYCGAYGYREDGPYGHKPAYDDMIQAASGLAMLQAEVGDRPAYVANVICDKIVAMTAASAVSMALFHRERNGFGQNLQVPMFETMVNFLLPEHWMGMTFEPPLGPPGYERVLSQSRRPYKTKDGYVAALPYSDRQWEAFFRLVDREELLQDPRFSTLDERVNHIEDLYGELADILATRDTAEWMELLDEAQIPVMAVNSIDDLASDPHLVETGFWNMMEHPTEGALRLPGIPVDFSESPGEVRLPPPRLGEHTAEVLGEAGLSETEIGELLNSGVAAA
ncbi:MAG: CoA transferase [Alphaproteobacteria bacterium]|nr:CoA transferase [Alphaproteobacteria bacterium]|tara:strand:+ start:4651 stop:5841 length:1191 start_codon:yes stop_codon:yes gene_type:complete